MRGCGTSLIPMFLVCCGICLLRILWVIFISPLFSAFYMVIVSYSITWATTSVLFVLYYHWFKRTNFQ